jgi:hypothetical protein
MSAAVRQARDILELAPNRIREIIEVAHHGTFHIRQGKGRALYEIKMPLAGTSVHSAGGTHR